MNPGKFMLRPCRGNPNIFSSSFALASAWMAEIVFGVFFSRRGTQFFSRSSIRSFSIKRMRMGKSFLFSEYFAMRWKIWFIHFAASGLSSALPAVVRSTHRNSRWSSVMPQGGRSWGAEHAHRPPSSVRIHLKITGRDTKFFLNSSPMNLRFPLRRFFSLVMMSSSSSSSSRSSSVRSSMCLSRSFSFSFSFSAVPFCCASMAFSMAASRLL
mmetsp:Transcript_50753/g.127463  ORF Transcript_50753/g.127463 Transcript_50753/m.127463 type:complete len:212 (-) Transcript_50753:316-951(-)